MRPVISALCAFVASLFQSRWAMQLKILALQHQVAVYKQTVSRPKLRPSDRLLWAWLSRLWLGWPQALAFVQLRTVLVWHKKRCRDYGRSLRQKSHLGRPAIAQEVRELIRDMWRSNPTWGAPRIVGELRTLGINVATSTVEQYRPRGRKPSSPPWKALLKHPVKDIVACDCFTVPTASCTVLFVFIMLAHERRPIVPCNITEPPTAQWTRQQIVAALPWNTAPRSLLRDRDSIDRTAFQHRMKHRGSKAVKMAPRSPWHNPYCERLIGRIRRDGRDPVIGLHERHLRRVLTAYLSYDHRFRTHLSLEMDCPHPRAVEPPEIGKARALPEGGGRHHPYERQAA
jgi:putative transposase